MESVLKLGPYPILFLLLLFLAACDSQQTSEEETSLDGLGIAGVEITTPFSSSSTTENGGTVSTKVRLKSAPLSPVTITLSSSDTQEGTVSPSVLTFNKDNWDSYVSIIVTGVDDDIADGSQSYEIQIASVVSDDSKYSALNGQINPIKLQNEDDEIKAIVLGSLSGDTTEAGGNATFSVKLASKPIEAVSIPIISTDTSEGTVSVSSLSFDNSNYNTVQTVTVNGEDDDERDGNIAYQVKIGPTSSNSLPYNNVETLTHSITNIDNETSGVTVSSTNITTDEAGSTSTFSVKLVTKPSKDVTINLRSTDPGEGVISASKLTFTGSNYSTAQTVTVTGIDDTLADGSQTFTVQLFPITGSGSGYDQDNNGSGFDPDDVTVVNTDNEAGAGIAVTVSDNNTSESGDTGSLTVSLNTEPSALVIIPVDDNDSSEASVIPSTLIFTPTNWNSLQIVTVQGVDDLDIDDNISFAVNLGPIISSDSNYSNIPESSVSSNTQFSFLSVDNDTCLLYTSPSPRDCKTSRMPSSA